MQNKALELSKCFDFNEVIKIGMRILKHYLVMKVYFRRVRF